MPSKRQFTVILTEKALVAVNARSGGEGRSRSAVISSMIERYDRLMAQEAAGLDLQRDELRFIARILEPFPSPDVGVIQAIGAMARLAEVPDDLTVRESYLLTLLDAASVVGRVAVVDQIEQEGTAL